METIMNDLIQLFTLAAGLAGLLAWISIWSPRRLAVKGVAVASAVLFMPVAYASMVELLSKPKPVDLEWWLAGSKEATVLGSTLREDQGIYLWLQLPDSPEPRAYVLPWSRQTAEQLQKAQREAQQQGEGELRMRLPFESTLDDREPKFYALPQQAPPPKELVQPPPQIYQPPGRDA